MKIALNLGPLSDPNIVALAGTIIHDLTGNSQFTPKPTIAALQNLQTAALNALSGVEIARQAFAEAVAQKDAAIAALKDGLTAEAATIQSAVDALPDDQQEAAILSAGMKPQRAPVHVTELGPATHLALSAGDLPGTLDWHCDPVEHAKFYVIEYTLDPISPTAHWVTVRPSTKSSGTVTGLTSGAAVSIRVHAEGAREITGAPAIAGPKIVP